MVGKKIIYVKRFASDDNLRGDCYTLTIVNQNIKKDYVWNLVGVFAQNAISPLLLIVVTRLNGIDDSGVFSFAFSIAIVFWAVGVWGGRTFQVSDVKKEFLPRSYVVLRVLLSIVMLLFAIIFSIINKYDFEKSSIIITLVLFKATECIADALYGIMQIHGKLYISGRSLLYKSLAGLIIFVIIDFASQDLILACVGLLMVNIFIVLVYDLRIVSGLENIKIHTREVKDIFSSSINIAIRTSPVFIVLFLSLFMLNIPRYFIDKFEEAQIGHFGILAMPITLVGIFMMFILQPNIVGLSELYITNKIKEFKQIVMKIMKVIASIGMITILVAYLLGAPVLGFIFGIDFSSYVTILTILVAGGVINAFVSIYINLLVIMRHFKSQFYILLATNGLLVVAAFLCVKNYGLLGGVWVFLIVNFTQLCLLHIVYTRLLAIKRA